MRTRERLGIATVAAAGHALLLGYLATARDDTAIPEAPTLSVQLVTLTPPSQAPARRPPLILRAHREPEEHTADRIVQPAVLPPTTDDTSRVEGRLILSAPTGQRAVAPGSNSREACARAWAKLGYPGVAPCHADRDDLPGGGYVADADLRNAVGLAETQRKVKMRQYDDNPAYYPGIRCAVFHRC